CTAAADSASVGQGDITRCTGLILMNSDQGRYAAALAVRTTHSVARGLGGNHDDIDVRARCDLAVVHVKSVCKRQRSASLHVVGDVVAVDIGNVFVRQQDHDQIGAFDGLGNFQDLQA